MNEATERMIRAFEGHDLDAIHNALRDGADASRAVRGKSPVAWLLQDYTRSDRLAACLKLLLNHGAALHDKPLLAVLLDDSDAIEQEVLRDRGHLSRRVDLISAFTSLQAATLLHVAAEYGNLRAAQTLIELGADVNAPAGIDAQGMNGHSAIFHTVNSNANRSAPVMELLLSAGARTDIQVAGLYWGKGYPWETLFFDVTPISYAQVGLFPQLHRREADIYANIQSLLASAGRPRPPIANVPNQYLLPKQRTSGAGD